MQMRYSLIGSFAAIIALFVACSGSSDSPPISSEPSSSRPSCIPNATQACVCAGGLPGAQVCQAGGAAFSPCDCGVGDDAGGAETDAEPGDAGGEAIDSAAPPVDAGTGQVAVPSSPCSPVGALACAGNYQKVTLQCGAGGTWQLNKTCGADEFCDSTPGPNAGICVPVLAPCKNKKPGDRFCIPPDAPAAPANLYECGPDTLTSNLVKNCRAGASTTEPPSCVAGACTVCTPGDTRCDGKQGQDCNIVGGVYTWRNVGMLCARSCFLSQIDGWPRCD